MIGNIYWNLYFAVGGGILTFIFSWSVNPWSTALWRSVLCCLLLFLFMFAVRLFLGSVAGIRLPAQEETVGQTVDLTTPEELDDFTPLEPEQMAQAVRKISEDEGR